MNNWKIHTGDALEILRTLSEESIHCCVTSPPYWGLRDYGADGQLGLEATPDEYVAHMVDVFREVRRVLRDDGTLWLNLGDSYSGSSRGAWNEPSPSVKNTYIPRVGQLSIKSTLAPKNLIGIPWRVAFALQADGWYIRSDIIWAKPNPMPESVADRPTRAHEYIFLISKSSKYFYDANAIREPLSCPSSSKPSDMARAFNRRRDTAPKEFRENLREHDANLPEGRNKRSVWSVPTNSYAVAHFATFPPALIEPCILAGCPEGGVVLDPFSGAGTTGLVALRNGREHIGIELNPEYVAMSEQRIIDDAPLFNTVEA